MEIDWTNVNCIHFGGQDEDSEVYALMGFSWSAILEKDAGGDWLIEIFDGGSPYLLPFRRPETLYQLVDELNDETLTD